MKISWMNNVSFWGIGMCILLRMVEEKAHLTPTISHRAYVLENGYIVFEGNGK